MNLSGCGLGLRREFIFELESYRDKNIDFFEITPENWINMPDKFEKIFKNIIDSNKIVSHGLSLSIGSFEKLDKKFLKELKTFLDRYNLEIYSEHLSFSSLNDSQTYELLPLPMSKNSANFIADKLKRAKDLLKRDIILENATYYFTPDSDLKEIDFINLVLEKSDSKLLLDVNNVYVNSKNHNFNPKKFIKNIDSSNVAYIHVAGHLRYDDVIIDTHGESVKKDVWKLLDYTYSKMGLKPTLLERDNNIPDLKELLKEISIMRKIYDKYR